MFPLLCLLVWVPSVRAETPHPDDAAIRQKMQDIMSRKEYTAARESEKPEEQEAQPTMIPAELLFVAMAVLIGLVLGGLFFAVARVTRYVREGKDRNLAAEQEAARKQFSRQYREEAHTRAAKGEYTEAIRYLFLSLVFLFDESGRVLFQRAYTNREYLTLFDERPAMRLDLSVFVDLLDDRWYGERMSSQQQYEHCLTLYDKLQRGG